MSDFTEFHDELRSVAGDLLAKDELPTGHCSSTRDGPGSRCPSTSAVPVRASPRRRSSVEEIGRAAATNGYLGGAVLAVGTLNAAATRPGTSCSQTRCGRHPNRGGVVAVRFEPSAAGLRVTGRADFVPDADGADRLLLLADRGRRPGNRRCCGDADGLTVTPQPVLDETRRLARSSRPTPSSTNRRCGPSTAIPACRCAGCSTALRSRSPATASA